MSIDPKIKEAIKAAVTELGQPEGLARKLESWFEAVATGNEDIANSQLTEKRLEMLYADVQLDQTDDEEDVS